MRVDPKQKWEPRFLAQPVDQRPADAVLRVGRRAARPRPRGDPQGREETRSSCATTSRASGGKAGRQILKDYIAFPALSGRKGFKATLQANFTANLVRNIWSNAIIFCGHFPDQAYTFTEEEAADESRGAWYIRQLLGAANIEGSDTFHLMSGNLSYQVEHHLFPDMPSSRYKEIAPKVKAICEKYELPYNTGPVPAAVADGAAHDPAPRVPGRRAAAEGAAVRRAAESSTIRARSCTAPAGRSRRSRRAQPPGKRQTQDLLGDRAVLAAQPRPSCRPVRGARRPRGPAGAISG